MAFKGSNQSDVDDLIIGGGGAPAISWKNAEVGTEFSFEIIDKPSKSVEKDDKTGEEKRWNDGNLVEQIVLPVQTNLRKNALISRNAADDRDPDEDDGERRIFIKAWGIQLKALREALKEAGVKTVAVGGKGTMKLVERKRNKENPTWSDTNILAFTYVPPVESLTVVEEDKSEDAPAGDTKGAERAAQIAKLKAVGVDDATINAMVAAGTI